MPAAAGRNLVDDKGHHPNTCQQKQRHGRTKWLVALGKLIPDHIAEQDAFSAAKQVGDDKVAQARNEHEGAAGN